MKILLNDAGTPEMRAFSRSILPACCLLLTLIGCDQTREGQQALFREPAPATRFIPGTTRDAEVRALLGEPGDRADGILAADDRFLPLSEAAGKPGLPVTRWRYRASRRSDLGPWPFARHQLDTAYLALSFDAAGVLRHMDHDEHHGYWERDGVINKLF